MTHEEKTVTITRAHSSIFKISNKTRKITIIALFSAICISTNYVMLPLLNIKFMDTIVFVTGFCLGLAPGIMVGSIAWLIYGTLNPLGFALPTLITVRINEMTMNPTISPMMTMMVGSTKTRAFFVLFLNLSSNT